MKKQSKKKSTGSGELVFDKETHKYTVNGEEYISATTFIKSFFHKFKDKKIAEYVAESRRKKGEDVTAKDVLLEWKQTAEEGSLVHKQIEEYINKGIKPTHEKAKAGVVYLQEHGLLESNISLFSEIVLKSDEYKIAGTCDLIAVREGTDLYSIVDWKTNKSIKTNSKEKGKNKITKGLDDCNYVHYTLQLSLYAYLFEEFYGAGAGPNQLVLVNLKNGFYISHEVPYMKETIKEMLKWRKKQLQKKS